MRRNSLPALILLLVLLVIFALVWYERNRGDNPHAAVQAQPNEASSLSASSSAENLTKYGFPVPHTVVGPYHVLLNQGYVSGYDAGIQDPRWVETRFFAVANPMSIARPKEFSTDGRIESEHQVDTRYWTDSGYDRGHLAPNWGVSICYGRQAQIESFLLTNVIPQRPDLNRGLWETLEKIHQQRLRPTLWAGLGNLWPRLRVEPRYAQGWQGAHPRRLLQDCTPGGSGRFTSHPCV